MSVSWDVFPTSARVPTFGELAGELADLLATLDSRGVARQMLERAGIRDCEVLIERVEESRERAVVRRSEPSLSLAIDEPAYGWLSLHRYTLGFDFTYDAWPGEQDFRVEYLASDVLPRCRRPELDFFTTAHVKDVLWSWNFRLQAAQPPATRLLAGLAAAVLARETMGVVHSGDGAGDYARLPCTADELLAWYPAWLSERFERG